MFSDTLFITKYCQIDTIVTHVQKKRYYSNIIALLHNKIRTNNYRYYSDIIALLHSEIRANNYLPQFTIDNTRLNMFPKIILFFF